MMTIRSLIFLCVGVSFLIGCQSNDRIVARLPDPVFLKRESPKPPIPPPRPQSVPVAPPSKPPADRLDGKTVVLDAGHGGKDPGAAARFGGQPEKVIALDITTQLAAVLRERGAKVIMTRIDDTFISLDRRAQIAQNSKTALFVSIHANSISRQDVSGLEILIYNHASPASVSAARAIEQELESRGIVVRSVRRQNLHVLREHSRPGVLIESGYLTNPDDSRNLNSSAYRRRLANALADGIVQALTK